MPDPCPHYQESGHYCSECGQQLMWKCECKAPVGYRGSWTWYPLSFRFCPGCGAPCPLPAPQEAAYG